jgi:hypothetical protein
VVLSALEVARCGNCGELVFTYDTEEQINRAYRDQVATLLNGTNATNGDADVTRSGADGLVLLPPGERQPHPDAK